MSNKDTNILRFTYTDQNKEKKFKFCYRLFENDFVERYKMVLQRELLKGPKFRQGLMYGDVFCDQDKIISDMNKAIDVVNSHKDREWIPLRPYPEMDHKHLMAIHQYFEDIAEDPHFNTRCSKETKNNLLKVNELIHLYETTLNPSGRYHIDVLFNEPSAFEFEDEDYKLFTPHKIDGYLYLDYGVTGVPVLNAFSENVKQKPVPQYDYKAGVKIYFHFTKDWNTDELKNLENWLTERWDLNINDPKLALGFIPLGEPTWNIDRNEFAENLKEHPILESIDFLNNRSLEPQTIEVDPSKIKAVPKPNYVERVVEKYLQPTPN